MKKQFMIYCSYPYSEDPEKTTQAINAICRDIYYTAHARDNDLLLMIPHNIFDSVFDLPIGDSNYWMPLCELTLIERCDAFAYDPLRMSAGVVWEKAYAEKIGKPIYTYDQLRAGARPQVHAKLLRRNVSTPTHEPSTVENGMQLNFGCDDLAQRYSKENMGTKYDSGKPMIDLIVPEFIVGMAKILTFGAQKYGRENWKKGLEYNRLYAALQRHALAYHSGEHVDSESGLSHMLHVACNAMFIFWYDEIVQTALEDKKRLMES